MVTLTGNLALEDFQKVIFDNQKITIAPQTLDIVTRSFEFLKTFSKNKVIYGVNTGFGPMAQYKIDDVDRVQLQYNLIRSHASGTGACIPQSYIKASVLARLNTLSLGHSGVHPSVINLLASFINHNISPIIFEHGGVGASGDLVQLAHLALTLIGEGEVVYQDQRQPTQEVFKSLDLQPIQVVLREGLGLINGTSVMSGIGIINLIHAQRLLKWSIGLSAALNEIVKAYDDHLSQELNATKKHKGQQEVARLMRVHLKDSTLTRKRAHHLYDTPNEKPIFNEKVQEYYSLRCIPQILGPVLDTLTEVEKVLIEEVNSANDNPIVDLKSQQVYHGGNFHGDYVSLAMDTLKIAVTKTSMLAERQLNFLLNPSLNGILPPFINLGKLGLNFGLQGMQFTATSTTAENQMLANPMYVHSIPNNNDNQDIVSMGTNAALITKKTIENTYEVLCIEALAITQAIAYLNIEEAVSSKTKRIIKSIQKITPVYKEDTVMYKKINEVKNHLMQNDI